MKLLYGPKTFKQLKKIGAKDLPKVRRKLLQLKADPLIGKPLLGEYKGEYTFRAWPLRIVYTFDRVNQIIYIIDIDYRGSVYKN